MGATLIDSLDTLWLMDMRREFSRARGWVAAELDTNRCVWLSALMFCYIGGKLRSWRAEQGS